MPHLDSEVSQGLNSTKSRPKSALFILTDHHRKKHTIDRDRIERIQRGIVIRTSITRKRWSDTRPGSVNVDTLLSCRLGPRSSRERRNCSTLFAMAKVTDWKEWPAKLYSDRKSRGIIPCQGFLPPPPPPPPTLSLSSSAKNRCKIRSTNLRSPRFNEETILYPTLENLLVAAYTISFIFKQLAHDANKETWTRSCYWRNIFVW